ncbi:MAG: magnesium/cobalt transporter CorA [Thermodesulfovibrionales bacterium]|nr:magnesium/cobalt transporter CorA [Thermodesulfovibrionales bacterium]
MDGTGGKISEKVGLPPGTLFHIGGKKDEKTRITIIEYDEPEFRERDISSLDEYVPPEDKSVVTWINIDGVHNLGVIEKVGALFNLHPLTLEDIVNTEQFPKIEDYGDYLFIVLKMLSYEDKTDSIDIEQVSLCLGSGFLVSFQEGIKDKILSPIRERIRNGKGRIRKMGADYLAYSLIDAIVDHYFTILEKLGERIETLEDEVVENPEQKIINDIHQLKRQLINVRRSIWPLREVLNIMGRGDSALITDSIHPYLRDVYDHTIRIIETIEAFRDILAGILDIYLSNISNRINAVMKVLTIIATIFMPLTFIAGIYGMNFKSMPELEWRLGYPLILLVMTAIGISMLIYFRRKKWL